MEEETEVQVIQGKHGVIRMVIPKREPTKEEIENHYKEIAAIIVKYAHNKRPAR